ncbi:hypothetical protein BC834DRAFT_1042325 [Gloeopeniophorella convolvens]|nr:hypothetical protein BC834DRAFT_1042325 [Gloeopeniophorella convolvens]
MDHHASPLRPEGEDLLQAALADPFSVADLPRVSPSQPTQPTEEAPPPAPAPADADAASAPEPAVSAAEREAWQAEYDGHVARWRRESADANERAEAERARWEERRAREGPDADADEAGNGWEAVSQVSTPPASAPAAPPPLPAGSPSPADARDLVAGEHEGAHSQGFVEDILPGPSTAPAAQVAEAAPAVATASDPVSTHAAEASGSPHWEHVPSSPTSSFPSMSFPEPSRPHSPAPAPRVPTTTMPVARPPNAAAATLAVFDDTLPVSKRAWALVSSLSINMLLPFVNGVMLGFGEIFAKTVVVGWLGWGPSVATNVGLGARPPRGRQ